MTKRVARAHIKSDITLADIPRVSPRPFGYRVNDAGVMLGVGRSTVFEMIKDGRLEAKRIGAATIVTHDSLAKVFQEAEWTEATKRARVLA